MTVISLIGRCNNCIKAGKECCTAEYVTMQGCECLSWKDADDYYRELMRAGEVDKDKCRK